jgi:hypothetical protein
MNMVLLAEETVFGRHFLKKKILKFAFHPFADISATVGQIWMGQMLSSSSFRRASLT